MSLENYESLRCKKVLITGGLGFLGSHLAILLSQIGANITLLDQRKIDPDGPLFENLISNSLISTISGDIREDHCFENLPLDFDFIIHMAGILGIEKVGKFPKLTADVNVFGTRKVLDFACRQISLNKILLFSTSEIYGINTNKAKEDDPAVIPNVGDRWIYASSKHFSELLLKAYSAENGLNGVIIRPFNIYGPLREGGAMTTFIDQALQNRDILISGDGKQTRCWCNIEDFSDCILKILANKEVKNQAFNIGDDREPISIKELVLKICNYLDSKSKIVISGSRIEDVNERSPDISKAKKMLGYCPKISLEMGIIQTANIRRQLLDKCPI